MPFTAFGRYEIAATTQVNGKTQEFCSERFVYQPILRLMTVLLTVLAVMLPAFLRKFAITNKQPWWLVAPVVLALLLLAFAPDSAHFGYLLFMAIPSQLTSISLFFWIVCSFRKRRRIISTIILLLINTGVPWPPVSLRTGCPSFSTVSLTQLLLLWHGHCRFF